MEKINTLSRDKSSEPVLDMTQILEYQTGNFKLTMINIVNALVEKMDR